MSNIVPLRGSGEEQESSSREFTPAHAPYLVRALYDLWMTGQIAPSAYHLGVQVAVRFQETDCLKTVLIPMEASRKFVEDERGIILSGLPFVVAEDYITALQDLHFKAGILNHYLDAELERENAHEGHFTLDPMASAGVNYTINTPIFFKFDPREMDILGKYAMDCTTSLREQFTGMKLRRI